MVGLAAGFSPVRGLVFLRFMFFFNSVIPVRWPKNRSWAHPRMPRLTSHIWTGARPRPRPPSYPFGSPARRRSSLPERRLWFVATGICSLHPPPPVDPVPPSPLLILLCCRRRSSTRRDVVAVPGVLLRHLGSRLDSRIWSRPSSPPPACRRSPGPPARANRSPPNLFVVLDLRPLQIVASVPCPCSDWETKAAPRQRQLLLVCHSFQVRICTPCSVHA
jgi:hypothetical protein